MAVFDIGGHLGFFTLVLACLVGDRGLVYVFEACPRHTRQLIEVIERNGLAQVTVIAKALCGDNGVGLLHLSRNDSMHRLIARSEQTNEPTTVVPTTSLDAWFDCASAPQRCDLIKLDIEGQELAALRGAVAVIERYRPVILCEAHRGHGVTYRVSELVEWLSLHDYEVEVLSSRAGSQQSLEQAVARLERTQPPPGSMAVIHLLARPGKRYR